MNFESAMAQEVGYVPPPGPPSQQGAPGPLKIVSPAPAPSDVSNAGSPSSAKPAEGLASTNASQPEEMSIDERGGQGVVAVAPSGSGEQAGRGETGSKRKRLSNGALGGVIAAALALLLFLAALAALGARRKAMRKRRSGGMMEARINEVCPVATFVDLAARTWHL
jgi:hypothetical protein